MYLLSIYFDEQTEKRLQGLIHRVADATGNAFMIENQVPPHITIAAVETKHEEKLITRIEALVNHGKTQNDMVDSWEGSIEKGDVKLVSIGTFLPQVIYVQPVLNRYLHNLSVVLTQELGQIEETICSPYYQPFGWLPHCTIAKQLSKEQMVQAFQVLQNCFAPMDGRVVRIGLAKTNPHRDIKVWELGGE